VLSNDLKDIKLKTNCTIDCIAEKDTITMCTKLGSTVNLKTQIQGNVGKVSYEWYELTSGLISGALLSSYNAKLDPQIGDKSYIVKATDTIGCFDYDTVFVRTVDRPITVITPLTAASVSTPATFTFSSLYPASQYFWNFGDPFSDLNNTSNLRNPSHTYQSWGEYNTTLITANIAKGITCFDSTAANAKRIVNGIQSVKYEDYHPMIENSVWYVRESNPASASNYYTYRTDIDTVISGKFYKKILKIYSNNLTSHFFIREDTIARRVYGYNGSSENLIYDFLMQIGDEIAYDGVDYKLASITPIHSNTGFRKEFNFANTLFPNMTVRIVEGIGSLTEPFEVRLVIQDPTYNLMCAFSNNQLTYSIGVNCSSVVGIAKSNNTSEEIIVYPNPANTEFMIKSDKIKEEKIQILNSSGQVVKEEIISNGTLVSCNELKSGLYFLRIIDKENKVYFQKLQIAK